MARTPKKEKALTPEEKLAQALVPDVEQPYRVPENWCWTRIYACCEDMFSGKSPKYSKEQTEYPIVGQQANQRYGIDLQYVKYGTKEFALTQEERFFLRYNDVLLNTLGTGSIGRSGIYKSSERILTDGHPFVFRAGTQYISDLLYYYLQVNEEQIINTANGSTNQKFLSLKSFSQFPIPLPPLAEQQRIVDRIESLFAKLDEAKEKAHAVVDGFEDRKAAILHKAFTGELTCGWRKQNNISLASWLTQSLKKCCDIGSGGTPSRKIPEYYEGDIPWIKTGEIDWNDIYDSEEHISHSAVDNSSAKMYPAGAVLVAMYGMGVTRGRAAILKVDATTNQAVCVLQPKENLLNRYLYYYFMCNYWDIREQAVGGNQLNLSATIISKFEINIPPITEQAEIISILDNVINQEQHAIEAAEQVIDQIDAMKKSILARAFRGELGTNDPADESAVELLKRVL